MKNNKNFDDEILIHLENANKQYPWGLTTSEVVKIVKKPLKEVESALARLLQQNKIYKSQERDGTPIMWKRPYWPK